MQTTQTVIRRALEGLPVSIRTLAREAGISHTALLHVRDGRFELGPDKLRALATVFRRWSEGCGELADELDAIADQSEAAEQRGDEE